MTNSTSSKIRGHETWTLLKSEQNEFVIYKKKF